MDDRCSHFTRRRILRQPAQRSPHIAARRRFLAPRPPAPADRSHQTAPPSRHAPQAA
ncbi:hypothetical protein HMPREF0591_0382, partial [Mycobacterium parascrofulaceum ATCC BAA-614]